MAGPQAAPKMPSLNEVASAVAQGAAEAEEAASPIATSPSRNLKEGARSFGKGSKAPELPTALPKTASQAHESELSGDDTCSTNVSDDEHAASRYGFDFDALPSEPSPWSSENPSWQHERPDDFSRSSSGITAEESAGWQTCLDGGFSRSVTEQLADVLQDARTPQAQSDHDKIGMFDFDGLPPTDGGVAGKDSEPSSPRFDLSELPPLDALAEKDSEPTSHRSLFDFDDLSDLDDVDGDSEQDSPRCDDLEPPTAEALKGGAFCDDDPARDRVQTWPQESRARAPHDDDFEKDRAQTCAAGFGFDFDDLPPIPGTTYTPTAANARSGLSRRPSTASAMASQELRPLQPLPTQRRTFISRPQVTSAGQRVAVVLNGSVGDVQPLVALARQLELHRHRVRVFTTVNLVGFVRDLGLDGVPVFADSQAVIKEMGGMVKSMKEGMSLGSKVSQTWVADHKTSCLQVEDSLRCFRPQAIVCGIQALGVAFSFEKKYGVPVIPVYLSWDAYVAFQDYASIQPARPSFLAVSGFLEARPQETTMPKRLVVSDEFVLHQVPSQDDLEEGGCLAKLRRFLGEGKPPVAVGWGSMIASGMKPAEMLGVALRALRIAGQRGVIIGGWANLDTLVEELKRGRLHELGPDGTELMDFAARDVCFVNSAPHEWLFPQCCSVVQHGGVGTWQAAIRAGKPAVVTPIFADQFSHAAIVERLGLGFGFRKPLQEVEPQELANAIILAEAKTQAAEAVGQKMRTKVGERDVASMIDDFLRQRAAKVAQGHHQQAEQLPRRTRMSANCTRRLRSN